MAAARAGVSSLLAPDAVKVDPLAGVVREPGDGVGDDVGPEAAELLRRDDLLGGAEQDRLGDQPLGSRWCRRPGALSPSLIMNSRKFFSAPRLTMCGSCSQECSNFASVGLGELLRQRVDRLERPLPCRGPFPGERVGVLAAGALVEPAGLLAAAVGGGCPQRPGDLLHCHVVRVVGAEVDEGDLVLGVGVLGDLRDDLLQAVGRDDGELHLHEDPGDVGLVLDVGVVDRRGGLAAVDDLQVVDAADGLAAAGKRR